jgi:hypothetical protein
VISHHHRATCSCACRECFATSDTADIHEHRINIKFCLKLGKTFMEAHEMMKNVYGDQCMSPTCCYEWLKRFREWWQSTQDEPHLGWPSTSYDDAHVVQVCEIVLSNSHLTVQEIAEECNISLGCHDILTTKLELHRVVSKFVPWLLTQHQRGSHIASVRSFWITLARMKSFWKEL